MKEILVVDDEPDQLFVVRYLLEKIDSYKVIPMTSGRECLEYLQHSQPDLILLDIMMPEMTGWEVYNTIQKNPKLCKIPIVFVTGTCDYEQYIDKKFSKKDFLEKPYDSIELRKRIREVLRF